MVRSYGTLAVGPCDGTTMVAVDMTLPSVSTSLPARPAAQESFSVQATVGAIRSQETVMTRLLTPRSTDRGVARPTPWRKTVGLHAFRDRSPIPAEIEVPPPAGPPRTDRPASPGPARSGPPGSDDELRPDFRVAGQAAAATPADPTGRDAWQSAAGRVISRRPVPTSSEECRIRPQGGGRRGMPASPGRRGIRPPISADSGAHPVLPGRRADGLDVQVDQAPQQVVRVQRLDVELRKGLPGEVHQVEGHDRARPAADRRGQDVAIVEVGEGQALDRSS